MQMHFLMWSIEKTLHPTCQKCGPTWRDRGWRPEIQSADTSVSQTTSKHMCSPCLWSVDASLFRPRSSTTGSRRCPCSNLRQGGGAWSTSLTASPLSALSGRQHIGKDRHVSVRTGRRACPSTIRSASSTRTVALPSTQAAHTLL
jgi:hypothetical protein